MVPLRAYLIVVDRDQNHVFQTRGTYVPARKLLRHDHGGRWWDDEISIFDLISPTPRWFFFDQPQGKIRSSHLSELIN